MNELKDITDIFLEGMKKYVSSETTFNLWFGSMELLSLTDEKAVFKTPTDLRKRIIEKQYGELMAKALEEAIGFPVEIEITAPPASDNKIFVEDDTPTPAATEEEKIESEERKRAIDGFLNGGYDSPKAKSLLAEYTFENFIEGESNKFAKAACYAVAQEPTYYNPLFIYGHSGLGKTHLLYAVINYIKENHPDLKIVYRRCEDFMNELIEAISKNETIEFKEKYRTADVLLIDDIQFIAGKVATQEEFFHTFSTLYEADKQIILTSDRPPKEIRPLEERLRTRFESGLIADVLPPSFELRTAIIRKKASSMNLLLSNEMVDYMAEKLQSNIRQIEGVLKRLHALYKFSSTQVSKESIDQTIAIVDPGNIPTDALVERILKIVSKFYDISVDNMKSKKKTAPIANARHVAIYLIKEHTNLSYQEVGSIFLRDHSTAISSHNKIYTNVKTMRKTAEEIKKLNKEIKEITNH